MKIPRIGLLACNSLSSNSGTITGIAAMQVVKEYGSERVGLCSLPALTHEIPRQVQIAKNLEHMLIIDGCANACAQKTAEKLGLTRSAYLNLEHDLQIKKQGPFSTLMYSEDDIKWVADAIRENLKP
jgi:uncharacterized metal-binding protein